MTLREVSIDILDPNPFQPRQSDEDRAALEELAADIARNGLIHPPVARAVNGRYQLACGHRRVVACRTLGWEKIPVDVRELSDQEMALIAWSENESRRSLNPLDRAAAIRRMMDTFGWTQEEAAQHLGLARSTIANILRLLGLRPEVQEALRAGHISERQALALAPLSELQWEKTDGWAHKRVRELLEGKRQMSSDEIRNLMRAAREEASRPLSWASFDQSECAGCPSNDKGKCFNVECYERKMEKERERAIQAAQQETGIPRWDGDKPITLLPGAVRKARERQCPNLRLAPSRWDSSPVYVCALQECQCARDSEKEFNEELQRRAAEREELITNLANRMSEGMHGIDLRILRSILVLLVPTETSLLEASPDILLSQAARIMAVRLVGSLHWPGVEQLIKDWEDNR